ncbi:MAG: hypothetical protein KGI97_02290 [Alphaproteobacteria bacterium]|nr:hypothetical protein [Alphaproteobacteria bacterium]
MTNAASRFFALAFGLFALTACDTVFYPPTPHPDYAIRVTPNAQGGIAKAPACMSWATATTDPFDNQPLPQFGCANARNLAAMVARPDDLIAPGTMGPSRGTVAVGAIRRYDNNQTRGLVLPGPEVDQTAASTAPTTSSSLTGDITNGGSSSASSAASTSGSAP